MRSRRFTILAVVLVGLNVFFWLAPAGFALREAVINQLFGPNMIRAEVVVQDPTSTTPLDYRIDRGVIVAVTPGGITLREADGTMQPIAISGATRLAGAGRFQLAALVKLNVQVLVIHVANQPAASIQVEGRIAGGGQGGSRGKRDSLP